MRIDVFNARIILATYDEDERPPRMVADRLEAEISELCGFRYVDVQPSSERVVSSHLGLGPCYPASKERIHGV